jgi:Ribonuclease G/E
MVSLATTWIAHYNYSAAAGEMHSTMTSSIALSFERATEELSQKVHAEEFVASVHAESEDQFLGSVRHQAANMPELTINLRIVELLHEDGEMEKK